MSYYNDDSLLWKVIRRGFAVFAVVAGLAALATGIYSIWTDVYAQKWANTSGVLFGAACCSGIVFLFWQMVRDS